MLRARDVLTATCRLTCSSNLSCVHFKPASLVQLIFCRENNADSANLTFNSNELNKPVKRNYLIF